MELLYNLGINDKELKNMLEQVPEILNMSDKEIYEKIEILTYVGCSERHIKNIVISNPYYLDRSSSDILKLIRYLKKIKINNMNLLFDSNPYLLNKDDFEIENYVENRMKNGDNISDIVDDIDSNPYIIDEE